MVKGEFVDGLKELDYALAQLPVATGKNVARKVLRKAAQPILDEFKQRAPRDTGELIETAAISTKLSSRQRSQQNRTKQDGDVTVFVGPAPVAQAVPSEFGTEDIDAQPALTPAWENNKADALIIIKNELGIEIKKSAERLKKKARK